MQQPTLSKHTLVWQISVALGLLIWVIPVIGWESKINYSGILIGIVGGELISHLARRIEEVMTGARTQVTTAIRQSIYSRFKRGILYLTIFIIGTIIFFRVIGLVEGVADRLPIPWWYLFIGLVIDVALAVATRIKKEPQR